MARFESLALLSARSVGGLLIISPVVGPVRGTSVIVAPSATTTYTLYSTNAYGRTTASVTVTVQ